jgi:integrase
MPRLSHNQVPALRAHKPSGRAVVTLDGKDYYVGPIGSEQAASEYKRLIQVWWSNGRTMPRVAAAATVGELVTRYRTEYERSHQKRGEPTSQVRRVAIITRELADLFGDLPVARFGSEEVRTLRSCWIDPVPGSVYRTKPVVRTTANAYLGVVVSMFRWGLRRKLVPPEVVVELESVGGLAPGESGVEEPDPVEPVPDPILERVLAHLDPEWLRDVARLQRLTGMRPMEVLAMRPCDLDRSASVWVYTVHPDWFKVAHKKIKRHVAIGPKGQAILGPYLSAAPGADWYVFRSKRNAKHNRPYRRDGYRDRVVLACDCAGVPRFTPNALRHAGLTEARAKGGLDVAQALGGHTNATMTERYAKVLPEKAIEWARENG